MKRATKEFNEIYSSMVKITKYDLNAEKDLVTKQLGIIEQKAKDLREYLNSREQDFDKETQCLACSKLISFKPRVYQKQHIICECGCELIARPYKNGRVVISRKKSSVDRFKKEAKASGE